MTKSQKIWGAVGLLVVIGMANQEEEEQNIRQTVPVARVAPARPAPMVPTQMAMPQMPMPV